MFYDLRVDSPSKPQYTYSVVQISVQIIAFNNFERILKVLVQSRWPINVYTNAITDVAIDCIDR